MPRDFINPTGVRPKRAGRRTTAEPYVDLLMSHLLGGSIPAEPLTWQVVPVGLMRPLIEALADHLSHHHRRDAPDLPPPVRHMAGWRKESMATDESKRALLRALWDDSDYECVSSTEEDWTQLHPELVQAVETGEIFKGEKLLAALASQNPKSQLAPLACVLWTKGLDDPRRARLFRCLIGLYVSIDRSRTTSASPRTDDENTELHRHLRELRTTIRANESTIKKGQSRLDQANRAVADMKSELTGNRQHVQTADRQNKEATARLARFDRSVRDLTEQVERLQKAAARAERQRAAAQEELTVARESLRAATEREAVLAAKWSDSIKALEDLENRIQQIATGANGVWAFLRSEDERVETDLLRLQGRPRQNAQEQHSLLKKFERAFLDYQPAFQPPRPVAAPALIRRGPLRYRGLGGAESIGASAYLLEIAGKRLLVDCGIRVGEELGKLGPDLAGIGKLDAVVLTHAHTDHVGWLPALVKQTGGDFEIFATKPTHDLIRVMLEDSLKQLRAMVDLERLKQRYTRAPKDVAEPYQREDVDYVLQFLTPLEWGKETGLRGDLRISLHSAGHIRGAASLLIEGDGRKVVVSGDFADFQQLTVGGAEWPPDFSGADLLIMESTYGAESHPARESEMDRLIEHVERVLRDGGTALIPCFALGRAQEVLTILARAMTSKALESVPVWIDGMIEKVDAEYRRHGWPPLPINFTEVRNGGYDREDVLTSVERVPSIVVTTSGMLAGGPGVEYAARLLPNGKNRLFFTGYLDEESPGYRMLNLTTPGHGQRTIKIPNEFGEPREIRMAMPPEKVQLSAHSDQPALIKAATSIAPAKIILVHGEQPARERLSDLLLHAHMRVNESSLEYQIGS